MPGQVPFQTETRSARRRSAAGLAAYPAFTSSLSSGIPNPSSRAAPPSSQTSNGSPGQAASSRPRASALRSQHRTTPSQPSVPQQGLALSSEPATPGSEHAPSSVVSASAESAIDQDEPQEFSPSILATAPDLLRLNPPDLAAAGPVISGATMAPVTHYTDSRPFLSPVLRAESSAVPLAEDLFLPAMPSSPLQQICPKPPKPTTPTIPSSWLDGSLSQHPTTVEEVDIADLSVVTWDGEVYDADLFPELRSSRKDADILSPELEANRFQFQNPTRWSFPSRRRNPNERCESVVCPIHQSAHNEGRYLFEGQESPHPNPSFGRSNPPPFIWQAYNRILNACDEQEDRLQVWGFAYCHNS